MYSKSTEVLTELQSAAETVQTAMAQSEESGRWRFQSARSTPLPLTRHATSRPGSFESTHIIAFVFLSLAISIALCACFSDGNLSFEARHDN
jgi:hypothetical protein